jgi:putative addiction module antidote
MKLTLTQIGNSVGAVFPKEVLSKLNVQKGDSLFLSETSEGYILSHFEADFEEQIQAAKEGLSKYRHTLRKLADS